MYAYPSEVHEMGNLPPHLLEKVEKGTAELLDCISESFVPEG